nr:A/G-specific adenine glycosylase [Chryseosolibacter indicus]
MIIKRMDKRYFSDKIVEWYQENRRMLPWRQTKDPYKIWLSEVILQQTRVNQGLPYYLRFTETFPTVTALANASEQEVLRLWQGLGYYSRARNLHKCAKVVSKDHHGTFPKTFEELKKLPGIGEYTAAAIASIAHYEAVAVVDGNVFRVLSRIFGIDTPINTTEGKKVFAELANKLIPETSPDIYNQAVMEFGAMYCVPKNPLCAECIFKTQCTAYEKGLQNLLPVKIKGKESRKRYFYYVVIQKGENSLLMKKRVEKDIWFGLYDFPLIESTKPIRADKVIEKTTALYPIYRVSESVTVSDLYKHVLTHQTIFCKFIIIKTSRNMPAPEKSMKFYSLSKVGDLPKPVLISKFLKKSYLL